MHSLATQAALTPFLLLPANWPNYPYTNMTYIDILNMHNELTYIPKMHFLGQCFQMFEHKTETHTQTRPNALQTPFVHGSLHSISADVNISPLNKSRNTAKALCTWKKKLQCHSLDVVRSFVIAVSVSVRPFLTHWWPMSSSERFNMSSKYW